MCSDNSKSIPIHCIVESLRTDYDVTTTKSMTSVVERDTYVIVPGHAPFTDLVRLTLVRIGYSLVDVLAARGHLMSLTLLCFLLLRFHTKFTELGASLHAISKTGLK